jgi:uncharacterized membrane protein
MTQDQTLLLVAGPIAAVGFTLPWIGHTHNGVLFGVSVPKSFEKSPEANRVIARYRRDCVLWALFMLAVAYACVRLGGDTAWLLLAMSAAGVPLELVGCFYLWHCEHVRIARAGGKLAELDAQGGIVAAAAGEALATPDRPIAPLLIATAAFAPLIAAALYLETHFASLPETFPVHWNLTGQVNGWGERTPANVFLPPLIGSVVLLLVVASTVLIGLAPGPESRHRMHSLAPLAALAWLLSVIFTVISLLPVIGSFALHGALFGVAVLLLSVAIVIWLIVRTAPAAPGVRPLHRGTSENHWRAGVLYVNPGDPAVLVPKRFGWGWTLNFARPASWMVLAFLVLSATTLLWLPYLVAR